MMMMMNTTLCRARGMDMGRRRNAAAVVEHEHLQRHERRRAETTTAASTKMKITLARKRQMVVVKLCSREWQSSKVHTIPRKVTSFNSASSSISQKVTHRSLIATDNNNKRNTTGALRQQNTWRINSQSVNTDTVDDTTAEGKGQQEESPPSPENNSNNDVLLVGEKAAQFDLNEQSLISWARFTALLSFVSVVMWFVWLNPDGSLGTMYTSAVESASGGNKQLAMLVLLVLFGIGHSGMASIRQRAESVIGPRAWRVIFASISLPLATSTLLYFIANRYSGFEMWNLRGVPGVHESVWILSFISFLFLYPSTFNLLEVAAIDEPKVHLYETGIIRITRHPQMIGQLIWCFAHMLWTGNSFVAVASAGLMVHHIFGCWHGDRRLFAKYGDAFKVVEARTSVMPFAAIVDGRQELPPDFLTEFVSAPYLAVVLFTVGAYTVHPLFQFWAHALKY